MEGEGITYAWWLRLSSPAPAKLNEVGAQRATSRRTGAKLGNPQERSLVLIEGRGGLGALWFALVLTGKLSLSEMVGKLEWSSVCPFFAQSTLA